MQREFLEQLVRAGRRHKLFEPAPAQAVTLGPNTVKDLLQHREPFLFVDAISALDLVGRAIRGTRQIDPADPVFGGHFPGSPVYPGVLQLEMMGQLGLCLLGLIKAQGQTRQQAPSAARAVKIHSAIFLAAIEPGAKLEILAKAIEIDDITAVCAGQVVRDDTICSFAVLEAYFVDS